MELIVTTKEELAKIVKDAISEAMVNIPGETLEVTSEDKYMSLSQLIHFLPEHPARQTVYGWVNKKIIPYKKIGSKLYFLMSEIEAWLDHGRQITIDEKLK